MASQRKPNSAHSNHLRSLTMRRKWAERKKQEREAKLKAEKLAKEAARAEYARRKKAAQLTDEEKRRAKKNQQRRQSRAKWDRFCSDIHEKLLLRDISASMREEAPKTKPTLEVIIKIAVRDYGFTITNGRLAQLKRILGTV